MGKVNQVVSAEDLAVCGIGGDSERSLVRLSRTCMGNCMLSRVHSFGFGIKVDVEEEAMRDGIDWACPRHLVPDTWIRGSMRPEMVMDELL